MPHLAATYLTSSDEAIFALANSAGQIQIVKLGNVRGMTSVNQLQSGSYLGRLWDNIGGMVMARGAEGSDAPTSLTIHHMGNDIFVFGLCKDHKLRLWSTCKY